MWLLVPRVTEKGTVLYRRKGKSQIRKVTRLYNFFLCFVRVCAGLWSVCKYKNSEALQAFLHYKQNVHVRKFGQQDGRALGSKTVCTVNMVLGTANRESPDIHTTGTSPWPKSEADRSRWQPMPIDSSAPSSHSQDPGRVPGCQLGSARAINQLLKATQWKGQVIKPPRFSRLTMCCHSLKLLASEPNCSWSFSLARSLTLAAPEHIVKHTCTLTLLRPSRWPASPEVKPTRVMHRQADPWIKVVEKLNSFVNAKLKETFHNQGEFVRTTFIPQSGDLMSHEKVELIANDAQSVSCSSHTTNFFASRIEVLVHHSRNDLATTERRQRCSQVTTEWQEKKWQLGPCCELSTSTCPASPPRGFL